METKKINKLREKESQLTMEQILFDKENQAENKLGKQKKSEKNKKLNTNLLYWDLSDGLLGI